MKTVKTFTVNTEHAKKGQSVTVHYNGKKVAEHLLEKDLTIDTVKITEIKQKNFEGLGVLLGHTKEVKDNAKTN